MASVTVSRRDDRLIAIKQVSAERAAEVEREAQLLERLAHPSVVRFVDLVETPDGGRALHTEFVSSHTWATRPLTDPTERAAAMASLAAVVADLHDLGLAHLRLAPGHVLHGEDDRPVLCGLARAGEATADNRHTDLAALADLCHDDDLERGPLAGKLISLADAARAGHLSARDLARKLDQLLAKRAPKPEASRRSTPDRHAAARRILKRAAYAGAAVMLAVACFLGVARFWNRGSVSADRSVQPAATQSLGEAPHGEAPHGEASDGEASHGEASDGKASLGEASAGAASLGEASAGSPVAAPDVGSGTGITGRNAPGKDGALDPGAAAVDAGAPQDGGSGETTTPTTGTADGSLPLDGSVPTSADSTSGVRPDAPGAAGADAATVLEHDGRRYAIGLTGDLVATGDWACDGHSTPAIVRPRTGDVVFFDAWPGPGETISRPVRWKVEAPTGVEVLRQDSCDLLRVTTATGSRLLTP